jgi:hypothetical protein
MISPVLKMDKPHVLDLETLCHDHVMTGDLPLDGHSRAQNHDVKANKYMDIRGFDRDRPKEERKICSGMVRFATAAIT